jgi:KipI family sensor histidine kinase inhibitor
LRIRRFSNIIYVEFCDVIDPDCNSKVVALDRTLSHRRPAWLIEAVPAYGALALVLDPTQSSEETITDELEEICAAAVETNSTQTRELHRLSVKYGGENGPDLAFVARNAGVTEAEVIAIHTSREYLCYMLGFTPGFAYLGNLDDRIASPRVETPRLRVPAGSVGIAGNQTGFYGVESPGGWRIIGRLLEPTFDAGKQPPSTVLPGDRVRFVNAQ